MPGRARRGRAARARPAAEREQAQARVLGAELEQFLLGLDRELDRRGHLVGVEALELRRLELAIGRLAHELAIELSRGRRRAGVARLGIVVQELSLIHI